MSVCEVDPELCGYSGHCWLLCFCVRGDCLTCMLDCEVALGVCGYSLLCFWGTVCMSVCEVDPELCGYSGHCWLLCFCVRGDLTSQYQPEYPQTPGSTSETKIQESPPPQYKKHYQGQAEYPQTQGLPHKPTYKTSFFCDVPVCACGWVSFLCLGTSFPKTDTDRHTHTQTHRRFAPVRCATVGALRDCGAEAGRAGSWPSRFCRSESPSQSFSSGKLLGRKAQIGAGVVWRVHSVSRKAGWEIICLENPTKGCCFEWVDVETAKRNSDIQPQSQRPKCQTSPRKGSDITARRVRHRSTESQTS